MADIHIRLHPGTLKHASVTYSINSYNARREPVRATGTKRMTMFGLTARCRMFPGSALKLQHKLHSASAIVKYSVSNVIIITTKQLKMQRLNSHAYPKKSQFPQTAPNTLHAHAMPFSRQKFPVLPPPARSMLLEGRPRAFSTYRPSPRCFGVFVWIILLILPILTVVQILEPCTGCGIFSRNPRFRADKTMCGPLRGPFY